VYWTELKSALHSFDQRAIGIGNQDMIHDERREPLHDVDCTGG
jgi:hypothetical protein